MKRKTNNTPKVVQGILQRVSESDAPYSGLAGSMLVSLSLDEGGSSSIALPADVLMLMDRGIIPMRSAYSEIDLMLIMDDMASALRSLHTVVASDDEDDFDLRERIAANTETYRNMTNTQLKDMTFYALSNLSRQERYAKSLAYLDVMADRGLAAKTDWITFVSDYNKLKLEDE